MKTLKVLSIDFDYFQNVSEDVMQSYYPDGHDHNTFISSIVWQPIYFYEESNKPIMEVTLNKTEYDLACALLSKQSPMAYVMVRNSHVHIYDVIKEHFKKGKYDNVKITHIDMHHDMFNNNSEVDCGNWLSHVASEIPTEVTWVANPVSRSAFGLGGSKFDMIKSSIDEVPFMQYDIIYICRSDCWLPPHLDRYFDSLFTMLDKIFASVVYEGSISEPRDIDYTPRSSHKDECDELYKLLNKMAEKKKGKS